MYIYMRVHSYRSELWGEAHDVRGELQGKSHACRSELVRLTLVWVSLTLTGESLWGTRDVTAGVVTKKLISNAYPFISSLLIYLKIFNKKNLYIEFKCTKLEKYIFIS